LFDSFGDAASAAIGAVRDVVTYPFRGPSPEKIAKKIIDENEKPFVQEGPLSLAKLIEIAKRHNLNLLALEFHEAEANSLVKAADNINMPKVFANIRYGASVDRQGPNQNAFVDLAGNPIQTSLPPSTDLRNLLYGSIRPSVDFDVTLYNGHALIDYLIPQTQADVARLQRAQGTNDTFVLLAGQLHTLQWLKASLQYQKDDIEHRDTITLPLARKDNEFRQNGEGNIAVLKWSRGTLEDGRAYLA
jgi:hypothetical protein